MFVEISMSDYLMDFELQQAYFLRDCLKEEIYYELKDSNIIIYKNLKNGILEEISLDELIFYIHTDVSKKILEEEAAIRAGQKAAQQAYEASRRMRSRELQELSKNYGEDMKRRDEILRALGTFKSIFQSIDNIKKAVENMTIILKCDDCDVCDSENNEKNKNHESLAF